MEDQKPAQPQATAQNILAALNIRTMGDDLKKTEASPLASVQSSPKNKAADPSIKTDARKPAADLSPVPKPLSTPQATIRPTPQPISSPTTKPAQFTAPAPVTTPIIGTSKRLEQIFDQAQTALIRGNFEEAINLASKISQDKETSWTMAFRAKKLISDANEKREKLEKKATITTSSQTGEPPARTLPQPPSYLPTETLIIESDKISDLKLPVRPVTPASTPSAASAPPTQPETKKQSAPIVPAQIQTPIKTTPQPPTPPTIPAKTPTKQPDFFTAPLPTAKPTPKIPAPVISSASAPLPQIKIEPKTPLPSEVKTGASLPDKTLPAIKSAGNWLKLIIGGSATLIMAGGVYFYLYYWPLKKPPCNEGRISEACQCGGQTLETGFCCNDAWLDKDCSFTQPLPALISSLDRHLAIDAGVPTKIISNIREAARNIESHDALLLDLELTSAPITYANTLAEAARILDIKLPSDIVNNAETYNLLAYIKPTGGLPNDPNKEVRLALVIKQKNPSLTQSTLAQWEKTMAEDLKPMIIGSVGNSATADFQTASYHGGIFKYKNLPASNLTIDYVVKNDLLIIATSKNSAFYIFDAAGATSQ